MSSALIDPYKAAKTRQRLSLTIASEAMPRLIEVTESLEEIQADLEFFWDEQKRLRVKGQVSTRMEIICERCLEPMPLSFECPVNAAVVWDEDQATQLSSELEPWLGSDERINAHELLEDELLLALPIMPAHKQEECKGMASFSTQPEQEDTSDRQKPFADLASLIKTKDD